MKRRSTPRNRTATRITTEVGVAWYRPEQWERLRAISVDADDLEVDYAEWVANVEDVMRRMPKRGLRLVKVDVDVEELLKWCQAHHRLVDGGARAEYVANQVGQRHEGDVAMRP
jgi:hypothetical protein